MAVSERERRADALDGLAREILGTLGTLEFRRAEGAAEVDATFRLRGACVLENGWAAASDVPDGRERDEYDEGAVHVVCVEDDEIVGSLRLVPPRAGRPLPTERDFGIRVEPAGAAVDVGRIVSAPDRRVGRSHLILAGLFARGWLEARDMGFDRVVGAVSDRALDLYRGLGVGLEVLGPPREHWGEERSPVELAGADEEVSRALVNVDDLAGEGDGPLTRRGLLARVGGVAGALAVVGLPELAAGAPAARRVGSGATDRRTIGFVARIDQTGLALVSYGWLTRVNGLAESSLFTGGPATSSTDPRASDPSTARFTVVSEGRIASISALGSVINTLVPGRTRIFHLPSGGASFADPASFSRGVPVATFGASFQTNLALDSPDHAGATLGADLTQRGARTFTHEGRRVQLGRAGLAWSMRATGRGERTDPATPRSTIVLSGDMGVLDAKPSG